MPQITSARAAPPTSRRRACVRPVQVRTQARARERARERDVPLNCCGFETLRPSASPSEQEMEFEESGIGEECGIFGCVAAGEWPTQLEVAQILTLGLVALQHR